MFSVDVRPAHHQKQRSDHGQHGSTVASEEWNQEQATRRSVARRQGAERTQRRDAASANNASAFKSDRAEGLHNLLRQQQHQHQHATLIYSMRTIRSRNRNKQCWPHTPTHYVGQFTIARRGGVGAEHEEHARFKRRRRHLEQHAAGRHRRHAATAT